ncbi:hypothetical protein AB0K09_03960 [Streptomyces sp. NPDC049577]|uniref:hypothetical protein n=1 Tax=Streptomyces sp. NPDC049577 TaxID=3155153 RepID=UPI00344AD135
MSVKSRIAAVAVLTAAAGAVVYPTADAIAATAAAPAAAAPTVTSVLPANDADDGDGRGGAPGAEGARDPRGGKDTRPGPRTVTVQQVLLPDGSRARLHSGSGGTRVTVTSHGTHRHTLDTARPTADVERLHLRIIGGDTGRPTLRAQLDGSRLANYYDFASGSLRHTLDGTPRLPGGRSAGAAVQEHAAATASGGHRRHAHHAAGNPVQRVVEAGQVIKGRHDLTRPAVAGGAALLALGGGAYGLRRLARRRAAARPAGGS